VIGTAAPELKTRLLAHDRFIGICRTGHPVLGKPGVTAKRYVRYPHVVVTRKSRFSGPVDDALDKLGLSRTIAMAVPSYANAMQVVRHSDLLGLVPHSCLGNVAGGLEHFELPVRTPGIRISAIWHPRVHADPAHRWFRDTLLAVCGNAFWRLGGGGSTISSR